MSAQATQPPVDHHVLRLAVGLIAVGLAIATSLLSPLPLESISASYHVGGAARDILVGSLVAVGAIMFAHNGHDSNERRLSTISAVAALGVALFPCDCGRGLSLMPSVHYTSAVVLFVVLTLFCWGFYRRARAKDSRHARRRATLYLACGVTIAAAVLTLLADYLLGGVLRDKVTRLVFYGETVALVAFGIAWLVASRILPPFTANSTEDRVRPWSGPAAGVG